MFGLVEFFGLLAVSKKIVITAPYFATFVNNAKELQCLGATKLRSMIKENLNNPPCGNFLMSILTSSKNTTMSSLPVNTAFIDP